MKFGCLRPCRDECILPNTFTMLHTQVSLVLHKSGLAPPKDGAGGGGCTCGSQQTLALQLAFSTWLTISAASKLACSSCCPAADAAVREVLGSLEPGGRLALPMGWATRARSLQVCGVPCARMLTGIPCMFMLHLSALCLQGCRLRPDARFIFVHAHQQVRPMLEQGAEHGWSLLPAPAGSSVSCAQGLPLAGLRDGSSVLMCCAGMGSSASGTLCAPAAPCEICPEAKSRLQSETQAAVKSYWMSIAVDGIPLVVPKVCSVGLAQCGRLLIQDALHAAFTRSCNARPHSCTPAPI